MPRIRSMLPQVKDYPNTRPSECKHCGSVFLPRHGQTTKPIKDFHISEVSVDRYKCTDCHRTFRHYPQGVDSHTQSKRLRGFETVGWALGLSLRSVSHLATMLGCAPSLMSV